MPETDRTPCPGCQRAIPTAVAVCPFCGHRRAGIEAPPSSRRMAGASAPPDSHAPRSQPGRSAAPASQPGRDVAPSSHPAREGPASSAPGRSVAPATTCSECRSALGAQSAGCRNCGWDSARALRICLRCEHGIVEPRYGTLGPSAFGAAALAVGVAVGWRLGWLPGVGAGALVAAIGDGHGASALALRCGSCGREPPPASLPAREREAVASRRSRHRLGAVGLALIGLGAVGVQIALDQRTLRSDSPAARGPAPDVAALVARGDEAVPDIVAALGDDRTRSRAVVALSTFDAKIVPALVRGLASADADARRAAAALLARFAPDVDAAIPALTQLVRDPNPWVRAEAVRTLAKLGPAAASAVPTLAASLLDDPPLRADALGALRAMGPDAGAAVPSLVRLLQTTASGLRVLTVQTLGAIGPAAAAAVPSLQAAADDRDGTLRDAAKAALEKIAPSGTP